MVSKQETTDELLARALAATEECPTVENLAEVASGVATTAETLRVRTHAASCARCDAELLLAESFYEQGGAGFRDAGSERSDLVQPPATVPARAQPAGAIRSWAGWLVAAALLLGIALPPILRSSGSGPLPAPIADPVRRGGSIVAIAPQGRLGEPPAELRWDDASEAARYRVDLRRVDRSVLWSAEVEGRVAAIPTSVLETLRPRTRYSWVVIGLGEEGQALGSSAETRFLIEGEPDS